MKAALQQATDAGVVAKKENTLPTQSATQADVQNGSPQTPGYQPNYGQTMKPAPVAPEITQKQD